MPDDESSKPESLKVPFGTAIGAAMMGFEQALRREPPAEVLAAEHVPQRGSIGLDGELVVDFPEPLVGVGDRLSATGGPALPGLPLERGDTSEEDEDRDEDEQHHGR
jgi:hypothetical protein